MAGFQELIKNFDRIRDYMRQFYVYGYKVRNDYGQKSARTYDNERRRIEAMLTGYVQEDYTASGKQVYINVDSKTIPENPLYAAWKSKSFTSNDLMLHFFLLDVLWDASEQKSVPQLADTIATEYGAVFDPQTLRLKCKEYEALGILSSQKLGKSLYYSRSPCHASESGDAWKHLLTAVAFYQGTAPFGFLGSSLLDREGCSNLWFQFKHQFLVHTLEDGILGDSIQAIHQERRVKITVLSGKSGRISIQEGIPLQIFVSVQTGRRYLCLYLSDWRRFQCTRLDSIQRAELLERAPDFAKRMEQLMKHRSHVWGVSFSGDFRMEELFMKLWIDEETEDYVLDRLYREGRGGEILRVKKNVYLYSGAFYDSNEMLSWVKTFTGRILDIQGTNQKNIAKILGDLEEMYRMYR